MLVQLATVCGFEYTESNSPRAKFTQGGTWSLGEKDGRHDWAVGIEWPVLLNLPADGPDESGFGDLKLRLSHTWLEKESLLVGSYFETEFDTADSSVRAIANQRNQLTLGSGFIRNFGDGWAMGGALQYGWSLDAGTTNGTKSEWEYRAGIRKKFADALSLTIVYKGTVNVSQGSQYTSSVEPSLTWAIGKNSPYNLHVACEIPLEDNREDFTAKMGLALVF